MRRVIQESIVWLDGKKQGEKKFQMCLPYYFFKKMYFLFKIQVHGTTCTRHTYKYKSIRDAHQDMAKIGDSGGSVVIV